jgi:hypothetical protein
MVNHTGLGETVDSRLANPRAQRAGVKRFLPHPDLCQLSVPVHSHDSWPAQDSEFMGVRPLTSTDRSSLLPYFLNWTAVHGKQAVPSTSTAIVGCCYGPKTVL